MGKIRDFFSLKPYSFYYFEPKEDITAYEVAMIYKKVEFKKYNRLDKGKWGIFERQFNDLSKNEKRHFKKVIY